MIASLCKMSCLFKIWQLLSGQLTGRIWSVDWILWEKCTSIFACNYYCAPCIQLVDWNAKPVDWPYVMSTVVFIYKECSTWGSILTILGLKHDLNIRYNKSKHITWSRYHHSPLMSSLMEMEMYSLFASKLCSHESKYIYSTFSPFLIDDNLLIT